MRTLIARTRHCWQRWQDRLSGDPARRALAAAMSVEGQIQRNEAGQLIALARDVAADMCIVEIGSFRGRSAVALALGARLGNRPRVYAVDPHTEFHGMRGGRFGTPDQAALYRNLHHAGVGDLVAVISLASTAAARGWSTANIGLLFLDGDHQFEAVRADLEAWIPFVPRGGSVAFHDSDTPDVQRVIQECEQRALIETVGRCAALTWCRRRE